MSGTVDRSASMAHRVGVSTAALDRLLAFLIAALVATGFLTLRTGAQNEAWVFWLHGVLAGALAVTVAMKLGRSLPKAVRARRWGRVAIGLLLSAATIGKRSGPSARISRATPSATSARPLAGCSQKKTDASEHARASARDGHAHPA